MQNGRNSGPAVDARSPQCKNAQADPQNNGNEPSRCSDLTGRRARIEGEALDMGSRNENIDVCSVWSQHGDFRVTVASRVPDHHAPLPAIL